MSQLLTEFFFKEYRRRVLSLLLLAPDKALHVRKIARLTNTTPGTVHKELSKLAQASILTKSTIGNLVTYQANRNCIIFEELASILRKTSGINDVLGDALSNFKDQIRVALVFGSVASGKANEHSDIDLLLIGNIKFANAVKALYSTQDLLGREINPKLLTINEWQKELLKNTSFSQEIMQQPTLKVFGDISDLGQLIGEKS